MKYDLIVVGGGPAGCAAAITAARAGARVVLLERGRYPRHKVCGEFISPESVAVLSSLLLPEDRVRIVGAAQQIGAIRIFVDGRIIRASIKPNAIGIPRYELDWALWRACEAAGVNAMQGATVDRIDGPTRVLSGAQEFRARAVVDATGRWSNIRRNRIVRSTSQFVGLKGHFAEKNAPRSADLYFFSNGYCGVQPVGDGVVNVCAMLRAEVATRISEVFELDARLADRARSWTPLMKPVSTFPLMFRDALALEDGVFNVGDAAGFIDPFVGDGISLALQTGVAVAETLRAVWRDGVPAGAAAEAYSREYNRRFRPVIRRAARVRRLFALPVPLRRLAATIAQIPGVSSGLLKLTRAA